MLTVMFYFFVGGLFALLMRTELMFAGQQLFPAAMYNQAMTFHGAVMVFMVIIPGIPAFLGNFILPLHLGAKDVAFPKVNLASWYCLIIGSFIALFSLAKGGADTGWTFYTPYSVSSHEGVVWVVAGAFVMGFSSILTGLNFIVTTHKLRAKGMGFFQMPLFVWGLYSTAVIQILATPVLAITLLLLIAERTLGIGIFDPAKGGDPVLFQHFFWFYSHPAVYIMILPAMGIISELVTAFSKKVIFGYKAIAFSSIGIAGISFFVWGHHLYVSSQSEIATLIFQGLTLAVGVPTAIKVFNWTATLYKGSLLFRAPLLFAFGFLFLFTIGGVTGVVLALAGLDVHFHDTYFVVAHFHYVMVGGTLMAIMGGIYYWFPKMFGRMYHELGAQMSFAFIFIGFNLTFFPQFILGSQGLPRRYHDYLPAFEYLNTLSTYGSYTIGVGFLVALAVIVQGIFSGPKATQNPWGATTLEWTHAASPPVHENFDAEPTISHGPYDYRHQKPEGAV